MTEYNIPGSGNSLVGPNDEGARYVPDHLCICRRCGEVAEDATDDGDEICEPCIPLVAQEQQEALELDQQIQLEMIWQQTKA